MKIGMSPKIGTPFVSMRGGVGGGVFIIDAAAVAMAVDVADAAVGCDCFEGVFFETGLILTPLVGFDLVVLPPTGVDLLGSAAAAVVALEEAGVEVDLLLSIFRFFFFGLSSMADSDVLASFASFDCAFFFPFDFVAASWSAFFCKRFHILRLNFGIKRPI